MTLPVLTAALAGLLLGAGLGALASRLIAERRLGAAHAEAERLRAELAAERTVAERQREAAERAGVEVREAFQALAADALGRNSASFLELATTALQRQQTESRGELEKREQAVENLVKPINRSLEQLREHVAGVEKERREAAGGLQQLLTSLREDQARLQGETRNLVNALRKPSVRGQWGEMTLRRIAELAGLSRHCDFDLQATVDDGGQSWRPDMVVTLPGGQHLAVDAKTPLDAYLDALAEEDEGKAAEHLKRHARHVRDHVNVLGQKSYWDRLEASAEYGGSPEFVVMFLRNEAFLYAALEVDPDLVEYAAERKVIVATPTTLIAILKSVAYGWRQERLAENARHISERGAELYRRLAAFAGHMTKVGKGLGSATAAYNDAVGSLERSVLPEARRFPELGVSVRKELGEAQAVEATPRELHAPELQPEDEDPGDDASR